MESIEVKKERPGEASTNSVALKEKMRRRRYARLVVDMTCFDASRGGRCEYYFSVNREEGVDGWLPPSGGTEPWHQGDPGSSSSEAWTSATGR